MWLFIKSLFMIKDNQIAREMVSELKTAGQSPNFKLNRLLRRRTRRKKFKAHNTTKIKSKAK